MSRKFMKTKILVTVMACAAALGSASPLWAKTIELQFGNSQIIDAEGNASRPATDLIPELRLAMMEEMGGMMGSMMGGMGAGNMGGGMPAGGAMPATDAMSPMQAPMAAPSSMDMMGKMRGAMPAQQRSMTSMAPSGRIPGFPGASHLYHIGATGFFLDHPQHIALSTVQQTSLNRIKEKALLDRTSVDRRVEDAEQELWALTAADSPDNAKIEAKVQAIEKLRGNQRLAYIRAVGEAGKVLTGDQQSALLGTKPADGKPAAGSRPPAPMSKPAPMPSMSAPPGPQGMPGMPAMPGMPRE